MVEHYDRLRYTHVKPTSTTRTDSDRAPGAHVITTPDGQPLIVLVHIVRDHIDMYAVNETWVGIDPTDGSLWYWTLLVEHGDDIPEPGPPRQLVEGIPDDPDRPAIDSPWEAWYQEPPDRRLNALAAWIQMTEQQTAIANDLMANGSRLHEALDAAQRLAT